MREVPLEECVREALKQNQTDTLSLLAASPCLPPGCMELLKKVRCYFVQGALLMNPQNPDHLKVGDKVKLSRFCSDITSPYESKFFNCNHKAVVKEIDSRRGNITVKGNSGEEAKINVDQLEKIPTFSATVKTDMFAP